MSTPIKNPLQIRKFIINWKANGVALGHKYKRLLQKEADMRIRDARLIIACLLSAVMLLTGCGEETGSYLIEAYIGSQEWGVGSLAVYVGRLNSGDPSAKEAQVTFNGTSIPLRALASTDADAVYVTVDCGWSPSTHYTLTVSLGGKTATASFTSPGAYDVNITSPNDYSTFVPGQALNVIWEYSGGNPDWMVFSVDHDSTILFEDTLDGSLTSYTFPGTTTDDWAAYSQISITANLGEYFWLFTGDLPCIGTAVLPASVVVLYPEGGSDTTWNVSVTLDNYYVEANGSNTVLATAEVTDDFGAHCPDGTPVTFSATPSGLVSLSPTGTTTTGGIATSTITVGSTAGTVNITASALGASNYAALELYESTEITITVGNGAFPQISWTPANTMIGLAVRESGIVVGNLRWAIAGALSSPITYGTLPSGATQGWPLGSVPPDSLKLGTTYMFALVNSSGDSIFHSHTRTAR